MARELAQHSSSEAHQLLEQEATHNANADGKIRELLDSLIQDNAGHVSAETQNGSEDGSVNHP